MITSLTCPQCETDNPLNARFCRNCGSPLPKICIHCGAQMDAADRFCSFCGQPAQAVTPTDERRLSQLNVAAPPALIEKIRSSSLTSDRRVVTALFADVVGSTSLAEKLDPEDWTGIMNRAFERMSVPIYQYEGTIARLLGDALLAFFGAPVTHEDDPVRAIHAAQELIDVTRRYAEEVRRDFGIDFAVRVGINTGPVVVGNVGSDLKYEYTAMGDAMNLAARMQSAARPMTVLITEGTSRFARHAFDLEDLGLIDVKGKSEPVRAYEVKGVKHTPERARGLVGLESSLVERDAELESLVQLALVAQAGAGRIALIMGEPGLGKSRLIAEWKQVLPERGHSARWAEGQCLSYGQQMAYHLLISLLRSLIGITAVSSETETRAALRAFLNNLRTPDSLSFEPYLAHLLALHLKESEQQHIDSQDPQSLQGQYLTAFRQVILALARQTPLVIVLEDVHWADPSSVEVLDKLLPLIFQAHILFCIVLRDDRNVPGWKLVASSRALAGETALEIRLRPLSEAASSQLVSNLLAIEALPEHVRALIHRKAEGNPFFIEEVIRMLIDEGMIEQHDGQWVARHPLDSLEIPGNLLGILLARIDRQPDEIKQTMRIASVIGRQFPLKVLEQVLEEAEARQLSERLGALETANLIRLARIEPEIEYLFRHALIQDAAYESLLKRDRQRLHLAVGFILAQLYPDRVDELAPMLAQHFAEGNDHPRAAYYFRLAGDNAARQYANAEAVLHYTHAIALIDEQDYALPQLYRARGMLYEALGNFEAARQDHEQVIELAHRTSNLAAEWRATLDLGMLWAGRDYTLARTYFEQAMKLGEGLSDPAAQASSLNRIGNWYVNQDMPAEGVTYHLRALEIFNQAQDQAGKAETLDLLGMATWMGGNPVEGLGYFRQSVDLFRTLNNPYGLSNGLIGKGSLGTVVFYRTLTPNIWLDQAEMVRNIEEGVRVAHEAGWRSGESFALALTSSLYATQGDYRRGLAQLDAATAIASDIEHRQWLIMARFARSTFYLDLWAVADVVRELEPALTMARELNSPYWTRNISSYLAAALLRLGELDEAERLLDAVVGRTEPPQTLTGRTAWFTRVEADLIRKNPRQALADLDFVAHHTEIGSEANEANYMSVSLLRTQALYLLIRSGADAPVALAERAEVSLQPVDREASRWPVSLLAWKSAVLHNRLSEILGRQEESRTWLAQAQARHAALSQAVPPELLDAFRRGTETYLTDQTVETRQGSRVEIFCI